MTAFVTFVRSYAVWLYLLCALGLLVGVKILTDARRLARTTLFSLEQERAGEQTYRGILLIVVLMLAMIAVTTIIVLIAPAVPAPESPFLRGPTATLVAQVFPSSTPLPSATATLIKPTETPFVTQTPVTIVPTRVAPRITTAAQSSAVTPTASAFALPPPKLLAPWSQMVLTGEGRKTSDLTFKWEWSCTGCALGPNDNFVIGISYTDRSGKPMSVGAGLKLNLITMGDIIRGYPIDIYQQAKEDTYYWNVQVKRGDQPLTPPSETWKFVWH